MILAIDAGNTRLKWTLCDGAGALLRTVDAVALADLDQLEQRWRALPTPSCIAIASVAGMAVNERIGALLARFRVAPQWLASRAAAGGVTNRYEDPAQLGVDRFCALVAARARHAGDCLVAMAGTATTIDLLRADGEFRGGVILPGVEMMKRALAANTAALPYAQGRFAREPRNTADAIESGCLHAHAGAIERLRAQFAPDAACILSGGAAGALAPLLPFPSRVVEHLVLEGAARLAER